MNDISTFVLDLLKRGVQLGTDGDQLSVRAPANLLSAEDRAALSRQKEDILALLRQCADGAFSLYTLSPGQRALWFVHRLAPESVAYNITTAVQVQAGLEVAPLQGALQRLVDRYQSLRTRYPALDGQPVQVIHQIYPLQVDVTDASGWSRETLDACLDEEADRPFDLEHGPILRVHLYRREENAAVLQLTVHHIAVDFWSLEILLDELFQLYAALRRGEPPLLPEPEAQYQDYVRRQIEILAGAKGEELRAYWLEQLGGELPVLNLPTDRPRPPIQSYRGASTRSLPVPRDLVLRLRVLAQSQSTTLYTLMLAAFQVLLHRYTEQTDILVGSPMSGRSRPEFKGIVGYLVNPIVLRGNLAGDPPFSESLRRFSQTVLAALEHLDYPFPDLVEQLQPVRDPSRSPLFQVGFAWDKARLPAVQDASPAGAAQPDRPEMEVIASAQRGAHIDLVLTVYEQDEHLSLSWRYNTDLFDAATIGRIQEHFLTLLAGIAADGDQRLSALPLLPSHEQQRLLVEWNQTQTPFPDGVCFHQLVEAQVKETPDAIALIFQDQQLTYRELDGRANQLAHYLQAQGVRPGVLVGICIERSPEMVIGILGTLKAGGAYVPLDPAYPQERLAFMLQDSQLRVLLTQAHLLTQLPDHAAQVVLLDQDWQAIARASADTPASPVTATDPAYVIYTSGSTGTPKGTLVGHRGLCNMSQAQVELFRLKPGDRVLQFSSLSFDASTFEICMALRVGATLCLGTRPSLMPGAPLLKFMQEHAITICTLTPSTLAALPPAGLPALHTITVAGEACPADLVARWAPGRRFFNLYGPTEATIWTTYAECTAGTPKPTIGRPILNTQLYVLDRNRQPVPIGVPGELYIGGVGLAHGYLNRPELTQERFVRSPFDHDPAARLYKTGDLVRYLPDGRVDFLGRIDHQVKVRGFRIELGEIETVLAQHPQVQEVVVLTQDETLGDRRLVAYVVPKIQEPAPTSQQLRHFLKEKLPEYMLPSSYILLDKIPVNANGKADRQALVRAYADQAASEERYVEPKGHVEQLISAIWQEVLKVEKVGVYDNFFDLGGHSLLLMQVHGKLQEQLGRELAITDLFQYSTVAALAGHLTHRQNGHDADDSQHTGLAHTSEPPAAAQETGAIAIVGMAGRFPKAPTLEQFWRNLCDGVEGVTFFSDEELTAAGVDPALLANPRYVKANCILEEPELFDAAFFGFTPREAALLDPQHRLFLECAHQALEHAALDPERFPGRIGVYAGSSANTYFFANVAGALATTDTAAHYQTMLGNDKDFLTTRVSYKLNLTGPSVTVQTACSTSLVAVQMACQALLARQCDAALAGGVSVTFPQRTGYLHQEGMILSPDGHCRTFDAQAQGTIAGQGAGLVVLKRLADALADGDTIHAVIRGSAINNDGAAKVGYTAPSITGQTQVIAQAYAQAGVDPATVSYVEAHGTATPLGDPAEVAALTQAFTTVRHANCALGSVKSNLGHLDAAAGIAGLLKTVLALKHRLIPPSLHYAAPNPQIDFAGSPFFVNTTLRAWESNGTPRRAGVSSFGIGGTNAHVVLEEAPAPASLPSARPYHLLLFSAKTPTALDQLAQQMAAHLRMLAAGELPEGSELADVAYTLQAGRIHYPYRRLLVCAGAEEAAAALASPDPAHVLDGVQNAKDQPVAFLFPGQGAQYVGMGQELYQYEPVFRAAVDECAETLRTLLGFDLRDVLYPDPEQAEAAQARLRQTYLTQPAIFVVEYALAQLWLSWGVTPKAMAGHSIGEYVAATLAGVFSLPDALGLVALRGRLMQQVPAGAMLAVPLGEAEVIRRLPDTLSLAAVNGPERCVVSGPAEAVTAWEAELAHEGLTGRRLQTSHAFHSSMMEPVLAEFEQAMSDVSRKTPRLPFLSNLTGTWIRDGEATDPHYWAMHLRQTVRFGDNLAVLLAEPDCALLEVGPGRTLATLARQHAGYDPRQAVLTSLPHAQQQEPALRHTLTTLGRLWLAGVRVAWEQVYGAESRRRLPLPTYPFERQRYWVEPKPAAKSDHELQELVRKPDMADWFYVPSWKRTPAPEPFTAQGRTEAGSCWLIFCDACGVGHRLAERLRQAGQETVTVRKGEAFAVTEQDVYTVNPRAPEDYVDLLRQVQLSGKSPARIVHLWGVTAGGDERPRLERVDEAQEMGFYSLLSLAQAIGKLNITDEIRLAVVTNHLHEVTGGEPLRPEKATVLGACKIIPVEYANIHCRSIDLVLPARPEADLRAIVEQILAESMEASSGVVAYRGPHRWVQIFEPVRLDEPAPAAARVREAGVYLITGGLGGMGLALAEHLAASARARLVLVGRSPFPAKQEWGQWLADHDEQDPTSSRIRKLQQLEALGAEMLIARADVSDLTQMQAVVAETQRRFGTINGVIHAAGVVDHAGIIQRRTREATDPVLAAKVTGTLVLDRVLQDMPLDFFVLCSTLGTLLPTIKLGEVGYCAANEFLDAFAQASSLTRSVFTVTINWTDWQEVGMSAATGRHWSEVSIRPEEGAAVFGRIVAGRFARVVVSPPELAGVLAAVRAYDKIEQAAVVADPTQPRQARPELSTDYAAPQTEGERALAELLQQMLGMERVGIHDNFFDLGADSLLLIQLHKRLQEQNGGTLPLDALFQYPTVSTLAHHLDGQGHEQEQAIRPGPDRQERTQRQRAALARQKQLMNRERSRR